MIQQLLENAFLLFGFWLAYQQISSAGNDRLNAKMFMFIIAKLIQEGNVPRAIKLCSASNAPLALAVKFVLSDSNRLRYEGPQKMLEACQDAFQEQAEITQAKRSIVALDLVVFVSVIALYFIFLASLPTLWVFLCLGLYVLAALYDLWAKTSAISDLKHYAKPLVDAFSSPEPSASPYR
jgi:hypothetical protein